MQTILGILLYAVLIYYFVENRSENLAWLVAIAFIYSCCFIFAVIHMHYVDYVNRKKLKEVKEAYQHGIICEKHNIFNCLDCNRIVELHQEEAREKTHKEKLENEILRQKLYEEWNSEIRFPEYLKTMDPMAFEKLVFDLFRRLGYDTTETPYVGDGAYDGYLRRDGHLYLLQCKRTKGSIGESIIHDLFGSITALDASGGIIVTTGSVSEKEKKLAADKPLEIIEMKQLIELIRKYYEENDVVPDNYEVPIESHDVFCPKCGSKLRKIEGKHGKFWGCSAYPECRFIRPIK